MTVSVAMCTCEGASYVAEQVRSIVNQSHPPDELVVWDDASSDNTLEIVRKETRESAILLRVYAGEQRVGHVKNFDRALQACAGDVVFLCDQDDVWFPKRIETMLSRFNSSGTSLVYCDATITDARLRPTGKTVFDSHRRWGVGRSRMPLDVVRSGGVLGCQMALSRELVRLCTPLSPSWSHDNWIMTIASATGRVVAVEEALQMYRRHATAVALNFHIDNNMRDRLKHRIKRRSPATYQRDLEKWSDLVERLSDIDHLDAFADRSCFDDYLTEFCRRKDLAVLRSSLAELPRRRRLIPVVQTCLSGDYARYLRSVGSPAKDLLRNRSG